MRNDFCPVKGRTAEDSECGSIICNATSDIIAVCRECKRGKSLLETVGLRGGSVAAAAAQPACAQQGPAKTAWQLVVEATGHTSQGRLADALRTNQSKISSMFLKLGKGKLPTGPVWADLLQLSGLSAQTLLAAATGKPLPPQATAQTASASSTAPLPVTSSPPQPDGSVPASEPSGTIGVPPTSMYDPNVGDMVQMGQGSPALADAEALDEIPADFAPYTPGGNRPDGRPGLLFSRAGEITVNAAAVRAYGLDAVERVQLYWSAQRGQVGMRPSTSSGLKLQPNNHSISRSVTARGFVRQFGFAPASGAHPLAQGPGGLLVPPSPSSLRSRARRRRGMRGMTVAELIEELRGLEQGREVRFVLASDAEEPLVRDDIKTKSGGARGKVLLRPSIAARKGGGIGSECCCRHADECMHFEEE